MLLIKENVMKKKINRLRKNKKVLRKVKSSVPMRNRLKKLKEAVKDSDGQDTATDIVELIDDPKNN